MGTSNLSGKPDEMQGGGGGGNLAMDLHLIQGGNYDTSGHFMLRKLR